MDTDQTEDQTGSAKWRVPGALEGRIRISPDFDVLPDEVGEAFGMSEQAG